MKLNLINFFQPEILAELTNSQYLKEDPHLVPEKVKRSL